MNKNEEEYFTHPSYGQLSFSRISCSGQNNFYGSELPQDHYIELILNQSEVRRDLTKEWYYSKNDHLLKVRMTAGQFSELITSLNIGSGVPCTIEWLDNKQIKLLPPQESRKEFVHRKFKERMQTFADSIKENQNKAKEIVKKKTLSKDDVHQLTLQLDWLTSEVAKNIPFFMECFQETMDEVVLEAKTEVENAIQHKISVLGLAELHNQQKLLATNNNAGEVNNQHMIIDRGL